MKGTFSVSQASKVLVLAVDDNQLIDAALAGNSAAFGELVRKYQDRLYNTMTHLTRSSEDARDAVQDAFVKAFVKLDTFQRSSGFYTWLYRIAFNTAMSQQRRRRPAESLDTRSDRGAIPRRGCPEPLDPATGPSDRLEREELALQVRAALETLSDEHRMVLILRDIDGCDYEAMAEMLSVPVGTVRSRLHRARLQLREQLKNVLQTDST